MRVMAAGQQHGQQRALQKEQFDLQKKKFDLEEKESGLKMKMLQQQIEQQGGIMGMLEKLVGGGQQPQEDLRMPTEGMPDLPIAEGQPGLGASAGGLQLEGINIGKEGPSFRLGRPKEAIPPTAPEARIFDAALKRAKTGGASDEEATAFAEKHLAEWRATSAGGVTTARQEALQPFVAPATKARAQALLDIAHDPKNRAFAAQKVAEEELARQGARPLPQEIQTSLGLLRTTKSALGELKGEFSPEERAKFVGVLINPAMKGAQIVRADPRFAKFQALMGRIKKSAFDDGGKQLTPFEFSVVSQYIPQGNEFSVADFEAKMEVAETYTDMLINNKVQLATLTKGQLQQQGLPPQPQMTPQQEQKEKKGRLKFNPQTGRIE